MAEDKAEETPAAESNMNRRQFLLLAAACAAASNPQSVYARSPAEQVIDAGPLSNYAADGLFENFRDLGFYVIRKGDKLVALSSNCTHRKCRLKAEKDHTFYCKCHGSTFDPTGKVTEGPATRDLPAFQTSNQKGHLLVRVPSVLSPE
jgi:Rieske Fe-S protein